MSLKTLYQGSVKNILGPLRLEAGSGEPVAAVLFEYTDAYSVFDWGRMPDALPGKGAALATLAADWFERLEKASEWTEFLASKEALELTRSNRYGSAFIEFGEELKRDGLRTHYLGVMCDPADQVSGTLSRVAALNAPAGKLAVREVSAVRPEAGTVLGRAVHDYTLTRQSPLPRLVPLEIVFRFSLPEGSSFPERVARDPDYLKSLGLTSKDAVAGARFGFPVMELFTKLEPSDRILPLSEAVAISGFAPSLLQEILLKTAWTAGFVRWIAARAGVELADGKFEWGVDRAGRPILVDAIGPDELRLLKDGVQLSKEFLRLYYRGSPWYKALAKAKEQANCQGVSDWKMIFSESPPQLPTAHREVASQLYPALTNALTGRQWFPQAWPLSEVVAKIRALPMNPERSRT